MAKLDKVEAAQRQLDTAIDMFFGQMDTLATYTVAYASFKVLMDVYPHRQDDDFAQQIDNMIGNEGWKHLSGAANFLKHADRDFDSVASDMSPMKPSVVIGLSTLLFCRITGDMTLKMRAFDFWVEEMGYEELGIKEIDENPDRVALHKAQRDAIRALPEREQIAVGAVQYRMYLENHDRIAAEVNAAMAQGKSITALLDEKDQLKER